jgi:Tfp pilus assembly protein PilX
MKFLKFKKYNKGYALYTSMILTSLLFLISYATLNLTLRQFLLSALGSQSHIAFYNADSGIECAMFWDLKNGPTSAFATTTAGTITCNGQNISTGSQTVTTNPSQSSRIGGGGAGNPVSIFQLNFTTGCVIVSVTKNPNTTTQIESRGYNSCSGSKRYERGIKIQY